MLGYGMYHFLRVIFQLENKFLVCSVACNICYGSGCLETIMC